MKKTMIAAMLGTMALSLAACGGKGDDQLGREVEKSYDNRADAIEQAADNMKDQAEQIRKSGKQQADALDDADVNAQAMTQEQKGALKNGAEKLR